MGVRGDFEWVFGWLSAPLLAVASIVFVSSTPASAQSSLISTEAELIDQAATEQAEATQAQARNNTLNEELRLWTPVYSTFPIYKRLGAYFEVNPRLGGNITNMNQLLVRPALTMKINRNLSLFGGYCWITNYQPTFFQEHRLWQQMLLNLPVWKLSMQNRTRFEQRWFTNLPGTAVRFRHLLGFTLPLGKTPWYLTAYDELFINVNSLPRGIGAGFDQNRIYAALGRKLNRVVRVETGYLQQKISRKEVEDEGNHAIVISVFADF